MVGKTRENGGVVHWFDSPGDSPGDTLADEDLFRMYRTMVLIRRFDEVVLDLWRQGLIRGTAHAYIGMEAGGTGVLDALPPDGYLYSYYRGHGHALARGLDPSLLMAEILGKRDGLCAGKGGSQHIIDPALGHLGANGIVGAGAPQAVGTALAMELAGQPRVTVTFFGEGASSNGAVHEAMNLASVWKLPVVFVCENNGYALSTSTRSAISVEDIALRAIGYGMPGHIVDGQDVLAVHSAARAAIDAARSGAGPSFMELKTFRYKTHSAANPVELRTDEEMERWRDRDPLQITRGRLLSRGVTEGRMEAHNSEVEETVQQAARFAMDSPEPGAETAMEDVYA